MVNYVVFLVLIQPIVCVENIPRIFAYPCDVPVASNDWIFCCRAEHLYDSPIFVFRNTPRQIVSSVTPVFDSSNVPIKFVFGLTTDNAIGIWGCGYYGGVSIYNLTEDRVVTRNSGYRFKDEGDNVTLTWSVMSGHVGVLDPLGRYIHQSELVFNGSSVSLTLQNVTGEMNGTYICISDKTRDALTVIVTYSPTAPSITAFKTTFSGSILSAKFNCMTTSPSAAPQFYVPKLNVSWVYSNTTGYTISEVGTTLYINGLNCDDKKSRPIFCSIREEGGKWSTASFKYPHELCILKPPPVVPTPDCITNSQQQQAGIIVGAIFGALCGICVILYAIYYSYKRCNDWDREDFEDCCSDCCDVVVSHLSCCRKCKKDDNSRLVVTLDISRDNEDELERLRNLYNIHDVSPNISVSEQPYSPTNIQQVEEHAIRDPTASSSATETDQTESVREGNQELNTEPEENLIASSPATELNPISSPATELNQTEIFNRDNHKRQELVIELENCLTDLSRLVDRRENPVSFRRSHIVDDVLNVYSDIDVLRFHLHVKLVGEAGSDWGGISRDIFTTFWNTAIERYFRGHNVYVPYLSLVNMRTDSENYFVNLGRILTHSTAILGFLPVEISKCSLMVMIYNTTDVDDDALIDDFLLYVDAQESKLIKAALENFSELNDEQISEIQELFLRFDMGCLLKQESFRDHLLKVARNELCIKPRYLCEKMRQGIPDDHFDRFWSRLTIDHIDLLHDRLKPTPENVLRVIKPTVAFGDLTRRRRRVYEFFQEYIGNLTGDNLQHLLHLITGQSCVPKTNITVDFSDLEGVQRRPQFHTCSYMVELPDSYSKYQDFQNEMNAVLQNELSKEFTMA